MQLSCPACGRGLKRWTISDIEIDLCEGGCGGIWFDPFVLQKVDQSHEGLGEKLLRVSRDPKVVVDHEERRACPKCDNITMLRHFYSVKKQVEVDECASCGGYWLDHRELNKIREQFSSEEECKAAEAEYFRGLFAQLEEMSRESKEKLEKARSIANMFRFICPSHYIPGKQDWGAF